jgi:hypothetical protein
VPKASAKRVFATGNGFFSPAMGSAHRSKDVSLPRLTKRRYFPSRDHSLGYLSSALSRRTSASRVPAASLIIRSTALRWAA